MATETELLANRIVLRAVLPVIKVMINDNPKMKAKFENVTGTVQFSADDAEGPVYASLNWDEGAFSVGYECLDNPDLTFAFSSVKKMNDFFAGKPVPPKLGPLLKGLGKFGLLKKAVSILLGLKILMPDAKPKTPEQAYLKVKMTLYMVSTALSQMNKAGEPEMVKFTSKQPERIYQWSVIGTDIACYVKIKAGKSKAGRGEYPRRKPFVHMKFASIDMALPVLNNSLDTITAMAQGNIEMDGSPEYGGKMGDFMLKIAALVS